MEEIEQICKNVCSGITQYEGWNKPGKNTVEYKTLCLVLFIATGEYIYYREGTTNGRTKDNNRTNNKESPRIRY